MRILIAEDDPVSRLTLETFLTKWGYQVISATNGKGALDLLRAGEPPRMAVLDWMMPEIDGINVCREVRKRGGEPYIYILLLTAKGQKRDIVEGLDAGADDYLTKPFDADELKARLRAGRRIVALQEALISAREALRFQAMHDPLTGLWTRAATLDVLRRELARSERQERPVSVIMADLDHFKQVNDLRGHIAGDWTLREAAHRIMSALRIYDSVGRYGGEEFIAVLPECDSSGGVKIAERLRSSIGKEPFDLPEGPLAITVSVGIASTEEVKSVDASTLIHSADTALYRAKAQGRNRVELFILPKVEPLAARIPHPLLTRQIGPNNGL